MSHMSEDTADRDKKIGIVQQRLKGPMHPEMRKKFEGLLAQLQSESPAERVETNKEEPLSPTPSKPAVEPMEPSPKRTIRIWTPDGDIEVVREEPQFGAQALQTDKGTGAINVADRDKRSSGVGAPTEQSEPSAAALNPSPLPPIKALTLEGVGQRAGPPNIPPSEAEPSGEVEIVGEETEDEHRKPTPEEERRKNG
jgi:hypothetical protein